MNQYIIDKLKQWKASPLLFVTECLQAEPTPQQALALTTFAKAKRTSIRSGHGTGKSTIDSWLIIWFLLTRPFAKVVCTAPTYRQVSDVLWSELTKWLRKSVLADEFVIQKDKIFERNNPKEWWCRAVSVSAKSSKDEQAETLAGFHGDHLLIVCDEASGIPDPVFVPLEGALTDEDNKVLLTGNMTKNRGYFYDTHFHPETAKKWNRLHWSCADVEGTGHRAKAMAEAIEFFKLKYGESSNVYRIRVLGEPPIDDENTLIPLSWSLQCVDQEVFVAEDEPLYLGVDVARYGDDKSIILPRHGLKINAWTEFKGLNTIDLGGHINQEYVEQDSDGLAIDEIGVGAGVTDWLVKHGHIKCFGVNVANSSSDNSKYDRLRDELWWRVRDKCMRGQYSFPEGEQGQELCNELSMPLYSFNPNGGIKIESKRKMKARGVASPNIADALCLTEYFASFSGKIFNDKLKKKQKKQSGAYIGSDAWMIS